MWLAEDPAGRSVKRMLEELDIPEVELRETLRKLDAAGLAKRQKGTWVAIPLEDAEPATAEAEAETAEAGPETAEAEAEAPAPEE